MGYAALEVGHCGRQSHGVGRADPEGDIAAWKQLHPSFHLVKFPTRLDKPTL